MTAEKPWHGVLLGFTVRVSTWVFTCTDTNGDIVNNNKGNILRQY